jgi:hypothetical protein
MTPEQRQKITDLKRCTFLPGSYSKRFVSDLHALPENALLTIRQAVYLDKLHYQYRRQISGLKRKGYTVFEAEYLP